MPFVHRFHRPSPSPGLGSHVAGQGRRPYHIKDVYSSSPGSDLGPIIKEEDEGERLAERDDHEELGLEDVDEPSSPPPKYKCRLGPSHKHYVPTMKPKELLTAEYVTGHKGALSQSECARLCCEIGPSQCQYVWLYNDNCFSVGCHRDSLENCKPRYVAELQHESIYTELYYTFDEGGWVGGVAGGRGSALFSCLPGFVWPQILLLWPHP